MQLYRQIVDTDVLKILQQVVLVKLAWVDVPEYELGVYEVIIKKAEAVHRVACSLRRRLCKL